MLIYILDLFDREIIVYSFSSRLTTDKHRDGSIGQGIAASASRHRE